MRKILVVVAGSLLLAGCYSSQCTKLGFVEGTIEHGQCVMVKEQAMAQAMRAASQDINRAGQQMQSNNWQAQQWNMQMAPRLMTCMRIAGNMIRCQ